MKAIALCDYEAYACDPYGDSFYNDDVINVYIKKRQKWDVKVEGHHVTCTRQGIEWITDDYTARKVFGEKVVPKVEEPKVDIPASILNLFIPKKRPTGETITWRKYNDGEVEG